VTKNPRVPKFKHFAKPYGDKITELISDENFRERIKSLREKWEIVPNSNPDEFWRSLVGRDNPQSEDYLDQYDNEQTAHQLFKSDLQKLCANWGLATDNWWVMLHLIINLDFKYPQRVLVKLPMPRDMGRIDAVERDGHLYLDVTWSAKEDVEEFWDVVQNWQRVQRSHYIKTGFLPDLLVNIKPGRPAGIDDELAIQCAHWKEEGKIYKEIRELVRQQYGIEWALIKDSYGNPNMCPTARNFVNRGKKLLGL